MSKPLQLLSKPLIVVGGVALDITGTIGNAHTSILHTSSPGKVTQTLGGVGRNVCEAAMRTGAPAVMVSVVGDDLAGKTIRQGMMDINMETKYITTNETYATAVYNALHSNDGQLVVAVADMDIFQHLDPLKVSTILENDHPGLVCFDGNISSEMMLTIATTCKKLNVPAFFEPTSVPKSLRIFDHPETILSRSVHFISPNQFELEALSETAKMKLPKTKEDTALLDKRTPPLAQHVLPQALYLSNYIPNVITKLGEYGCLYVGRSESTRHIEYFPPEQIAPHEIKSVTGAGDCFVGTLLANLRKTPFLEPDQRTLWRAIIERSQQSSIRTLKSDLAVSEDINNDLLVKLTAPL